MPQVALEALPGLALDRRVNTESTLMNNEAAGQTAAENTAHGLTCNLSARKAALHRAFRIASSRHS